MKFSIGNLLGKALLIPIGVIAISIDGYAGSQAPLETVAGLPIAKIKESVICCPNEEVKLDGWASIEGGGEITEWRWALKGDRKIDTSATTGDMEFKAPEKPGSFCVYLFVRDRKGNLSAPDSATVAVMNSSPRVKFGGDTTIPIAARISFEPHIETTCSKPVRYEWDFNEDGVYEVKSDDSPKTSRVYYKPGKYVVKFRVVDSYGKEAGGIKNITVVAGH